MSGDTLFSKIVRKELPADILYQDDLVTAFRDINPARRVHVLIIPNRVIPSIDDLEPDDEPAMGRMMTIARKIARDEGIAEDGYRLIINCGTHGRQEVPHVHMHLLGGSDVGPMIKRDPT